MKQASHLSVAVGVLAAGFGLVRDAAAQIVLPPVQVPSVGGVTQQVDRTVGGVLETADPQRLQEVRRLRIRELVRRNPALERDPQGAPIVRNEVVALSPSQEALDKARAAGFGIGRTRALEGLDTTIVVLQAPEGMSTRRALRRLRDADPQGTYDYNHVYLESGEGPSPNTATSSPAVPSPLRISSGNAVRVGLIDGGVQRSHPVFHGVTITEYGCAGGTIPSEHGTAVASLLVGRTDVFHGVAAGAQLYAADVYCGLATGGAVDSVAEAFAWMARERVPVINISLVGPPNGLLEQIVRIVTARGHLVVAAVGNDGPSSPPLYPAAYDEVIAVTAVDAHRRVLLEACRGKHVDFSAPGSNMSAAGLESAYGRVRGTSFAAPIVAGLLASRMSEIDKQRAATAVAALAAEAIDLGVKGPDKVYGVGLIGDALRPPENLADLR
jgi:subtilisin family serine protease